MKKRFIFDIFVVILLFLLAVPFTKCWEASAYSIQDFDFENDQFASNESNILTVLNSLEVNSSINLSDYYCFISNYSSGSIFLLKKTDTVLSSVSGARDYYSNYHYFSIVFSSTGAATFRNSFTAYIPFSQLSSYDFSSITYDTRYSCDVTLYNAGSGIGKIYDGTDSAVGKSYEFWQAAFVINYSFNLFPDAPELLPSDLEGYNLYFSYDVDSFYDWIINNNKLSELPSYIVQSKLKSFLSFYKSYGSSSTNFFQKISDWFSFMSIPNQTFDNTAILKGSIDKLYQEYLRYRSSQHAYWPGASITHNRDTISTNTDNNNTSLITDDSNDDLITSILRDILRGVIAISNQVYESGNSIIGALDALSFDVVVSNNGGYSGTDINPLLNKMDDIIEALQADTVSVDIDQTTQDDTDQFFDDWNLEFKTALDRKFPVAGQLSTLFTDFWEKCGVDVDNDGETFEYYNPGSLEARSEVRSLSSGTSELDLVSDFLNQFDDSDPAFLDDASFNSVPDLSVSIGGSDVSIFDFRVYAKYRDKIHFIISLVIWSLYLLHLYKALPTIIGQVADVAVKVTDD